MSYILIYVVICDEQWEQGTLNDTEQAQTMSCSKGSVVSYRMENGSNYMFRMELVGVFPSNDSSSLHQGAKHI